MLDNVGIVLGILGIVLIIIGFICLIIKYINNILELKRIDKIINMMQVKSDNKIIEDIIHKLESRD